MAEVAVIQQSQSPDTQEREARVISRSLRKLLVPGPTFRLTSTTDAERDGVERFIAERFYDSHNARVSHFMPSLLNIQCGDSYSGALGINPASNDRLFVETYFDQPAEQAIAGVVREPVSRNSIVEIGNLVSNLKGATALLYLMLLATVYRAGYQWVMFTGTPEVQRSVERLGFKIAPICSADPARLGENANHWGSYYDANPWVMVGYIRDSYDACLNNRLLDSVLQLNDNSINELAGKLGPR